MLDNKPSDFLAVLGLREVVVRVREVRLGAAFFDAAFALGAFFLGAAFFLGDAFSRGSGNDSMREGDPSEGGRILQHDV